MAKYLSKFAKQLMKGIRYDGGKDGKGLSVVELCHIWRVSPMTYQYWRKHYPEFEEAAQMGDVDYATFWHETFKGITCGDIKGNSGSAQFALTNVEHINWKTKVDVTENAPELPRTININMIQPRVQPQPALPDANIIDGETVDD